MCQDLPDIDFIWVLTGVLWKWLYEKYVVFVRPHEWVDWLILPDPLINMTYILWTEIQFENYFVSIIEIFSFASFSMFFMTHKFSRYPWLWNLGGHMLGCPRPCMVNRKYFWYDAPQETGNFFWYGKCSLTSVPPFWLVSFCHHCLK